MSKDSSSSRPNSLIGRYIVPYAPIVAITLGAALLFIISQLFGLIIFTAVAGILGYDSAVLSALLQTSVWAKLGVTFAIEFVLVGLIYWLLSYFGQNPLKFLKLTKRPTKQNFKVIASAYGLYLVSFFVLVNVTTLLVSGFNPDQTQQIGYASAQGFQLLAAFVALVVLPPIAEEIFFRGFLYQELKRFVSLKVAAVITSILFGLVHLEFFAGNHLNWVAALDTFIMSLFLIAVLERTKTLWSSIIFHSAKNLIAFCFIFWL